LKAAFEFAVLALLLAAANFADGQAPIEIARPEVEAHRISSVNFIRAAHPALYQSVTLLVEVDRNGVVTSAIVTEGPDESREAAVALAKAWRYRPFVRDGRTIEASFSDYVWVLPPERPVRGNDPFPAIQKWDSLKITLQRNACFGDCPVYMVQIDGNGDAVSTETYPVRREQRRHISREALVGLLEVFRKANYFSLDRTYRLGATDLPTYTTSIAIDGQSMSVVDYAGLHVGMPASVRDVEDAIDEAAGTRDWFKPDR